VSSLFAIEVAFLVVSLVQKSTSKAKGLTTIRIVHCMPSFAGIVASLVQFKAKGLTTRRIVNGVVPAFVNIVTSQAQRSMFDAGGLTTISIVHCILFLGIVASLAHVAFMHAVGATFTGRSASWMKEFLEVCGTQGNAKRQRHLQLS